MKNKTGLIKIMNISLRFLSLQSVSRSPLIHFGNTQYKRQVILQNSHFSKFISSIMQFNQFEKHILVNHNVFKKVLRTSLVFDSFITSYKNQIYYEPLVLHSFQPTEVRNCKFIGCQSVDLNGGAILSFGNIIVSDCDFIGCGTLKQGGTVMSHMNSTIERCICLDCESYSVCTFCTEATDPSSTSLSFISVDNGNCNRDGIINSGMDTETVHDNVNVSNGYTDGTYCGSQIYNKKLVVTFCSYVSNAHGYYSGGMGIEHCHDILIEKCFFFNLTRKAEHSFGGYCLYFGDTAILALVKECTFIHLNNPPKSSCHSGYRAENLRIENCCFSTPEFLERFGASYKDCQFGAQCTNSVASLAPIEENVADIPTKTYLSDHAHKMKNVRIWVIFAIVILLIIHLNFLIISYLMPKPTKKVQ